MPCKIAKKIELSEKEELILTEHAKGTHTPLHLKIRSQIILMSAKGLSNNEIENNLKMSPKKVKRWRDRYGNKQEELKRIQTQTPHKLRKAIEDVLADEQRPGAPAKFTNEQVAYIIAMSCEEPSKFALPFSHWTPTLLREEVIKLEIVEDISVRQVGRFLKRKEI